MTFDTIRTSQAGARADTPRTAEQLEAASGQDRHHLMRHADFFSKGAQRSAIGAEGANDDGVISDSSLRHALGRLGSSSSDARTQSCAIRAGLCVISTLSGRLHPTLTRGNAGQFVHNKRGGDLGIFQSDGTVNFGMLAHQRDTLSRADKNIYFSDIHARVDERIAEATAERRSSAWCAWNPAAACGTMLERQSSRGEFGALERAVLIAYPERSPAFLTQDEFEGLYIENLLDDLARQIDANRNAVVDAQPT